MQLRSIRNLIFLPAAVRRACFYHIATSFSPYADVGIDEIILTESLAGKDLFGATDRQYNYGVCESEEGYRWKTL